MAEAYRDPGFAGQASGRATADAVTVLCAEHLDRVSEQDFGRPARRSAMPQRPGVARGFSAVC